MRLKGENIWQLGELVVGQKQKIAILQFTRQIPRLQIRLNYSITNLPIAKSAQIPTAP
jgi:hypothetical protein